MTDERIVKDPKIMVGKPVIKGTRIPVYLIVKLYESGHSISDILDIYPSLKKKDVEAALEYSKENEIS